MAVPTTLAEALALLTFTGGDQITGQDIREVVTWLGGETAAFSIPLTIAGNRRVTVQPSDVIGGRVIVALAASGHTENSYLAIFIPAGTATSLSIASDLNSTSWEAFDPASDYLITIHTPGPNQFASSGRNLGVRDTTAPTIVAATILGSDPDRIVLQFSKEVVIPTVAALTLVGTAFVITGVVSGNGTDTVTLDMSGDATALDTIDFVIGSGRTIQDLNGNLIATGTTPITILIDYTVLSGVARWKSDERTLSGSNVLTVIDKIGSADLLADATKPTITTLGPNARPACTFIAGSWLRYDWGAGQNFTTGTIGMVIDVDTNAIASQGKIFVAMGEDPTFTNAQLIVFDYQGSQIYGRRVASTTGDIVVASAMTTTACSLVFAWNAAGAELYINGVSIGSSAVAASVGNVRRIVFGILPDLSTFHSTNQKWAEAFLSSAKYTTPEVEAYHDYVQLEYGL